jgi:hypothetical protein
MVKRSTRLAKRNALLAVEEAIGSSLGKKSGTPASSAQARDPRIEKPLARPKKKT